MNVISFSCRILVAKYYTSRDKGAPAEIIAIDIVEQIGFKTGLPNVRKRNRPPIPNFDQFVLIAKQIHIACGKQSEIPGGEKQGAGRNHLILKLLGRHSDHH